jgi:hypothetical protein
MDDVNKGQVRKVAIVVVILGAYGTMIGKGFIIARGKQSNQRKYTDTLRQFTMDYSPWLYLSHHNSLESKRQVF